MPGTKNLMARILHTVEESTQEFHAQYRLGRHYGWKEPGPPRWKMWMIFDLLRDMDKAPENEILRERIDYLSRRLCDIAIERTRNRKPRDVITAELMTAAKTIYSLDIKPIEKLGDG